MATNDDGAAVNEILTGNSHDCHPGPVWQTNGCQPALPDPDVRNGAQPAKHVLAINIAVNGKIDQRNTLFAFIAELHFRQLTSQSFYSITASIK
jgi:hypothetical protein